MQTPADLARPATVFLSYKREDAAEVEKLQSYIQIHGVQAWRDVTDMLKGTRTREEIIEAILYESDTFLLYATPRCLQSNFVWDVEVRTALERRKNDPAFAIIPVFRGVTFEQVRQCCIAQGYNLLNDFNGITLPGNKEDAKILHQDMLKIARDVFYAALSMRLRRIKARNKHEISMCLRTYSSSGNLANLDLDLNWSHFITQNRWPYDREWQDLLLPALSTLKEALSFSKKPTISRLIHAEVQAHLPVDFALGFIFSATSKFVFELEDEGNVWKDETQGTGNNILSVIDYGNYSKSKELVVEISISRTITEAVTQTIEQLNLLEAPRVRFAPLTGPDVRSIKNAQEAYSAVRQIGQTLRNIYDRKGIQQMHVFLACPARLAVLLGQQFNALGAITVYHHVKDINGYIPGIHLTQTSAF